MSSVTSLQVQQLRSVVLSVMLLSALLRGKERKKKVTPPYSIMLKASLLVCTASRLWGRNQEPISGVLINCSMSVMSCLDYWCQKECRYLMGDQLQSIKNFAYVTSYQMIDVCELLAGTGIHTYVSSTSELCICVKNFFIATNSK